MQCNLVSKTGAGSIAGVMSTARPKAGCLVLTRHTQLSRALPGA